MICATTWINEDFFIKKMNEIEKKLIEKDQTSDNMA